MHTYFLFIAALLFLSACSTTRYVPEGDYLYKGATMKVKSKEVKKGERRALSEELESILRPKPNRRFLGIPIRLLIYSFWGKPGKEKGPGNWIGREAGEPPVLFSDVRPDYQRDLIINRLENRGYFQATLERDSTVSGNKIKLHYTSDPGHQYLIDTVYFPTDSSILSRAIKRVSDQTFLKAGDPFDLDVIKKERERIDAELKEEGFYYFSPDYLLILADSTDRPYSVSLAVILKYGTAARPQQRFTVDNIFIFPNHSLTHDTLSVEYGVMHNDFTIIDPQKTFHPKIFDQTMFFRRGDLYNRYDHNKSLNRLIDLGVFKYVENRFEETGNSQLDVYYYLTPFAGKSVRAEFSGRSTSTNFMGAEVNVSWQKRNTLRGAEHLRIHAYGGTDVQISGINKSNDLYRIGAEINLSIPRFVTPFPVHTPGAFIPRTRVGGGYDRLNRVNSYVLNSFRMAYGYIWRESVKKEHQFTVFSVNYIQPSNISPEYQARLNDDPTLANAIQRQFIIGPSYNYNVTNTMEQNRKHTYYLNVNLDLSGNIIGLLSGANYKEGVTKELFGAPYSQYVRTEVDLRYYNDLGRGSSFATRGFGGFGFAYGNSRALPFVKQFFAGGSTGLRAFRARSLGPGTFRAEDVGENVIAADQTGDIKLEMNVEYRPHISGIVNGAIFADAGNIWLLRTDPERLGERFEFHDFFRELAVDFGVGLRFNFSFFILRTDLAFPLRKPWLPDGERWVIDEIEFGDREWRRENLTFNLAIGYPF